MKLDNWTNIFFYFLKELLDRKMTNGRNASGQSDSTSGCDSGRSYESENEPSDNSENQQMRMNQLNLNQSQQQLLLQQHLNARLPQPPSQSPYVQHGSIQPPLAQGKTLLSLTSGFNQ